MKTNPQNQATADRLANLADAHETANTLQEILQHVNHPALQRAIRLTKELQQIINYLIIRELQNQVDTKQSKQETRRK